MFDQASKENQPMSETQKRCKTIGLLTTFTPELFKSEYYMRITSGIVDALKSMDYDFRILMVRDDQPINLTKQLIRENQIDGVLLFLWRYHYPYIQDMEIPIVAINDYSPDLTASIVHCNHRVGVQLGFKHLLSRGYRKIALLQAPDEEFGEVKERCMSFKRMLAENEIAFDPAYYWKCDYYFEEDGYLKVMEMIHSGKPMPRAIMCFNDDLAIGAIRALRESWIKCPEDVAVIGYDGIDRSKYVLPPLTTVRQPLERMGREMVTILADHMEGKTKGPIHREFMPELVIRQST